MLYTSYPPGLHRRLAYSNYLRNRRNNPILRTRPARYNVRVSPIIVRHNIIPDITFFNYENLIRLQDVKIGLINKNLINKSSVSVCKNYNKDDVCVICQDEVSKGDIIRTLICKHLYHLECIDTWFSENKKCPTCKNEI